MAEFLELASRELDEAALWYDERQPGLGSRFLLEARAALRRIDDAPLAGPPWLSAGVPESVAS